MFGLIRRISGSFLPRNDRPWTDDATSSAPQAGRKRVLSTHDEDEDDVFAARKRARGDEPILSPTEEEDMSFTAPIAAQADAARDASPDAEVLKEGTVEPEVKAVTQGVKEVELKDEGAPLSALAFETMDIPEPAVVVPEHAEPIPAAVERTERLIKEDLPKDDLHEDEKEVTSEKDLDAERKDLDEKPLDGPLAIPLSPPIKVDDEAPIATSAAAPTDDAPAASSTLDAATAPLLEDTPTKPIVPEMGTEAVPSSRSPSPLPPIKS